MVARLLIGYLSDVPVQGTFLALGAVACGFFKSPCPSFTSHCPSIADCPLLHAQASEERGGYSGAICIAR